MKTFGELTFQQRSEAVEFAAETLVKHVFEGVIELTMRDARDQAYLKRMLTQSRINETPNQAISTLLSYAPFRVIVDKIAIAAAEGARYNEDGQVFIEPVKILQ